MIGLLDPALFLVRSEQDVKTDFAFVLRACQLHGIKLPPLDEYWPALWTGLARDLERSLSPGGKRPLQELRKRAENSTSDIAALSANAGTAWRRGLAQMFGAPWLDPTWDERMALAVMRAVTTGERVVVLSRRIPGRNLTVHAAGGCTLEEITRWVLHVQPAGVGAKQVLCVYHLRNLSEGWTARFDWRLPTTSDGARYPFCAPPQWWKGSTAAFRTVAAKPAWIDAHNNGWARPNIPGGAGYHWDVFVRDWTSRQAIGVDQINVVEFGVPSSEGCVGHLHHIPSAKAGLVNDVGWTC